jgi:hypothetical protein
MFPFFAKKRPKPKQEKPLRAPAPQRPNLPWPARLWAFLRPGTPYTFTDLPELQTTVGNRAVNALVSVPPAVPGTTNSTPPVPGPKPPKYIDLPTLEELGLDQNFLSRQDETDASQTNTAAIIGASLQGQEEETFDNSNELALIDSRAGYSNNPVAPEPDKELVEARALAQNRWGFEALLRERQGLPPVPALFTETKSLNFDEYTTTQYLYPMTADPYKLQINGGLLFKRVPAKHEGRRPPGPGHIGKPEMARKWDLVPYDTRSIENSMHPGSDEQGSALYVLSSRGDIYSGQGLFKVFHHSSFLAGGNVAAAGMMSVANGKLEWLSNSSGHYAPEPKFLHNILDMLERNGADLSAVTVIEDPHSNCPHGEHSRLDLAKWREIHS